jgi:hypothetical protein
MCGDLHIADHPGNLVNEAVEQLGQVTKLSSGRRQAARQVAVVTVEVVYGAVHVSQGRHHRIDHQRRQCAQGANTNSHHGQHQGFPIRKPGIRHGLNVFGRFLKRIT